MRIFNKIFEILKLGLTNTGGIDYHCVIDYWKKRSDNQMRRTVGYGGISLQEQDENYRIRIDFLSQYLNVELFTIDYGCGIGRYCKLFDPGKYIGFDVTENLIRYAVEDNPEYNFSLLKTPFLPTLNNIKIEQFMTCTVLQHNSDKGVVNILESLKNNSENLKSIFLYENTSNFANKKHIKFRTTNEYRKLVSEYFEYKKYETYDHVIHNEKHSVIKFTL